MKSYRETNYVIRFLKGLDEQCSGVRSQLMLMDPLPSIDKVYSMLTQQERQMNPHLEESRVLANFSDANSQGRGNGGRGNSGRGNYGGGRNQGGRGKRKICTYCNKVGHMVDTCYKKHSYPLHYKKSASNFVTNQEIEDENSDGSVYNAAIGSANSSSKQNGEGHTLGFTPDQHRAILALLQGAAGAT